LHGSDERQVCFSVFKIEHLYSPRMVEEIKEEEKIPTFMCKCLKYGHLNNYCSNRQFGNLLLSIIIFFY